MSDKKEIATLSIKISVDSTDLDKLEAQLKRIEGLMVSVGLKQPTSVGFSADKFFVTSGQVFIDESCIDKATIGKIVIQSPTTTIRAGEKQQSARAQLETSDAGKVLEQLNEAFSKSTKGSAMAQTIRINTAVDNGGLEEFKRQFEYKLSQLSAMITRTQQAIENSDKAFAASIERVCADIQSAKSGWLQ
ncbi:hypothetical protein [Providencia heimbachae]|uniref:Uncharacterized protein n=1 Tax=Providencia heimbachae ATCC 35613 TaxID=1354272 RepID=A0A1B7K1X3_9GAMM|nr:hypothetical protein [Providencia heimbachae]OAT53994.1 hypothetical protein M998_0675 [Providencia heimbachae ATCC 35613]SQH13732.1 Uncharacterised protein [Providencia heimbachae]